MDKTAQLIVAVAIVAFVIERITSAATFFIDGKEKTPEGRRTVGLIAFAAVLAGLAVWKLDLRLLREGVHITTHPAWDVLLTTLVIVAGAERIRDFIGPGGPAPAPPKESKVLPINIRIEDGEGTVRDINVER
jgi:hypothetical protein